MQRALTYPKGVAKGRKLNFPIKLRCTSVDALLAEPGLETGLARTLGRAFARARHALPASLTVGGGVALQPPYLAGRVVDDAQASTVLIRVQRALDSAARAQLLPLAATSTTRLPEQGRRSKQPNAEIHQPVELSERFDPARYDAKSETYFIPSYQTKPPPAQRGTPAKVRPSGEAKRHAIPRPARVPRQDHDQHRRATERWRHSAWTRSTPSPKCNEGPLMSSRMITQQVSVLIGSVEEILDVLRMQVEALV
jgi:hypothetical protein